MAKRGRSSAVRATKRVSQPTRPPARALASPTRPSSPRAISVRALESAPISPSVVLPAPEAVQCFEAGMEALQRHRYAVAAEAFNTLVARFPAERALLDRALPRLVRTGAAPSADATDDVGGATDGGHGCAQRWRRDPCRGAR